MDYGIKIPLQGKLIDSQDPRDFSLHSKYNTLKIFQESYAESPMTASSGVYRYLNHNLGYKPIVFGYFQHPEDGRWHTATSYADINTNAVLTYSIYGNVAHVDDNNLYIYLYPSIFDILPSDPLNVKNKVYILADPRQGAWFEPATTDTDNASYSNDYGLKISREGIDVKTAEPKNLVWSSAFPTFNIFRLQHFDYDVTRSALNIERVAHGLDYPPTFIALSEDDTTSGIWENVNAGYFGGGFSRVYVDDTYLYYNNSQACNIILCTNPLNE